MNTQELTAGQRHLQEMHILHLCSTRGNRGKPLGNAGAKVRVWIDGSIIIKGYKCLLFVI